MCIILCALKWIVASLYTFPSKEDQLCNMVQYIIPQQATTYSPFSTILFVLGEDALSIGWLTSMHSTLTMHGDWMIAFLASFFPDNYIQACCCFERDVWSTLMHQQKDDLPSILYTLSSSANDRDDDRSTSHGNANRPIDQPFCPRRHCGTV